ncbi:hypothetical protein KEM52_001214 [Ascosphaera acerosa]|nr:hypothetical protein KEM52_001214 [Ascosphaera acerosa]
MFTSSETRSPSEETVGSSCRSSTSARSDISSASSQYSTDLPFGRQRRATWMSADETAEGPGFAAGPQAFLAEHVKQVEMQRDMLRDTVNSLLNRLALQERRHEKKTQALECEIQRIRTKSESKSHAQRRMIQDVNCRRCRAAEVRRKVEALREEKNHNHQALQRLQASMEAANREKDTLRQWLQQYRTRTPRQEEKDDEQSIGDGGDTNSIVDADREARKVNQSLIQQIDEQCRTNEEVRADLARALSECQAQRTTMEKRLGEMTATLRFLERTISQDAYDAEDVDGPPEDWRGLLRQSQREQLKRRTTRGSSTRTSLSRQRRSSLSISTRDAHHLLTLLSPRSPTKSFETAGLRTRVRELERALQDADLEMKVVVNKMNMAQIEVLELQADREHALRQLRKLHEPRVAAAKRDHSRRPSVQSEVSVLFKADEMPSAVRESGSHVGTRMH